MRSLTKPKLLVLVALGPLLLLGTLLAADYRVIHSLLPPDSLLAWRMLTGLLVALGAGTGLAAGWSWRTGRALGLAYALLALLAYGGVLAYCLNQSNELLPRAVPQWLVSTDPVLYVWTFLMPALAHALLVAVVATTPQGADTSLTTTILVALGALVGTWLAGVVLGPVLPRGLDSVLWTISLTLAPLGLLYAAARVSYVLSLRRTAYDGRVWRWLVALVLPLLGLLVNAGFTFSAGWHADSGIFGRFGGPWFYGLALLNGLLLAGPAERLAGPGRLAVAVGRAALLPFTLYFFLVFLPFLPLSVFAVILLGTGFLMLTPLLLLPVHLRALADDWAALRPRLGPGRLAALLGASLLLLPLGLTLHYFRQRQALHTALAYVFSPDYTRAYDLDAGALTATLTELRQRKGSRGDLFFSRHQPYLDDFYNWLVLDNLMLSDQKLDRLERIFRGEVTTIPARPTFGLPARDPQGPRAPRLRQATAHSRYDPRQGAWVSWVELEVVNRDPSQRTGEYQTSLRLPPGCVVGGFYLEMNGRREPGILAERRAAEWVYRQILDENSPRDPGLLRYDPTAPDRLRLQVYPVVGAEPRRAGFQLLHRDPLTLPLDGQELRLGGAVPPVAAPPVPAAQTAAAVAEPAGRAPLVHYLSAADKARLPLVRRQPYYHFLLDASAGAAGQRARYAGWVAEFVRQHPAGAAGARFTLVSAYARPLTTGADWPAALAAAPVAGGCYFGGAVRQVLAQSQLQPSPSYPVLVLVTDRLAQAELGDSFADLAAAAPEAGPLLLLSGPDGTAEALDPAQPLAPARPWAGLPAAPAVRAWPGQGAAQAYLPANDEPAVVLARPAADFPLGAATAADTASRWRTGLLLVGFGQWQALHPAAAAAQYPALVRTSFRSQLLTPQTALLALENEAQKAALQRKQRQTLAANPQLDTQEAEPGAPTAVPLTNDFYLLLLLGLGLGLGLRAGRR